MIVPISGAYSSDGSTACKQPYWICLIDGALNGGDKVLVAYVHRLDVIHDTGS